jgi:transketolase
MIKRVSRDEAELHPLPGRNWYTYVGPQNVPTERVSMGVSVFPPGSSPTGHVHETQEETIYCAAGRGRIVTPAATAEIEPGVTVWVPVGTFHATESDGPEPLELVCFFSPPVVPGSYEKRADHERGPRRPTDAAEIERIGEMARRIRVEIVRAVNHARAGHLGGPLSAADLLAALYFHVLRIRPDEPSWPDRDRFILSKGHSSIGLYAAMALRGYFPVEELLTFDAARSRLQGHPDMTRLPGLDMSTGSLGMGISAGMGIALGARLTGRDVRCYVMLGDGECQEGEVWEAAMSAARYGLDNLVAIIDHNKLQQYGWPGDGPMVGYPKCRASSASAGQAFGWRPRGRRPRHGGYPAGLAEAGRGDGRPAAVIAHTVRARASRTWKADTCGTPGRSSRRSSRSPWPISASPCRRPRELRHDAHDRAADARDLRRDDRRAGQ